MSFFADMMMGAVGGAGQGMIDYGKQQELDRQRAEAQAEKAALALQLQEQRSADMKYRVDQDAQNKADRLAMMGGGAGGGSGAGGRSGGDGGFQQRMREADTPQKQDAVIREAATTMGPDAAAQIADKMYGRPLQIDTTAEDARIANDPTLRRQGAVAKGGNLAYDSKKGMDALNFVTQLASGKASDAADGQRKFNLSGKAETAAGTIANPVQSAETYQALSDPASRQAIAQTQADARVDVAAAKRGGGAKTEKQAGNERDLTAAVRVAKTKLAPLSSMEMLDPVKVKAWETRLQAVIDNDEQVMAIRAKLGRGAVTPAASAEPKRFAGFSAVPLGK